MSPIQQMLLGVGAKKSSVYIDDCFYTHVYEGDGNSSGQNITGSDFEPDLVWIKGRNHTANHILVDSARGNNKVLYSNTNDDQDTNEDYVNSRFVGGFKVGNSGITNGSNETNVGWTWKKTPGFFTICEWTGNGVAGRQIPHDLGSRPGMVAIKCTSDNHNWSVWHRGLSSNAKTITLNDSAAEFTNDAFNGAAPSSTVIHVSSTNASNANTKTYVAYLWAGGESTAATARSVDFDGSGDYLSIGSSSDFTMGTGDFTVEGWVKFDNATADDGVFQISDTSGGLKSSGNAEGTTIALSHNPGGNAWNIFGGGTAVSSSSTFKRTAGQWYHFAYVRHSSTTTLYINGENIKSFSDSYNYDGTYIAIGGYYSTSYLLDGRISNFRIVKGTAVYTSSFKPPTEPLTNITNTKLLCCNNSSTTGSTVTPGTITANGNPTASTDSPFDDPAAHVFGESGSESVIKCGSYVGNGSSTGPEIFLGNGYEPQFILMKNAEKSENWLMWDSMRGIVTDGDDARLFPNLTTAESTIENFIDLTSTGFKINDNGGDLNESGDTIIFLAIRRPDGYVGKPPELGTDAFNVVYGNSSSTIPNFTSNFPVDMGIYKEPTTSYSWYLHTRLVGPYNLKTDSNDTQKPAAPGDGDATFDSNAGWGKFGYNTDKASWLWKRHAGFDVVAYKGDQEMNRAVPHSLSKPPEMIWVKDRDSVQDWGVYHKGLDGGTNPETHYLLLNSTDAEADGAMFSDLAPTSSHFFVGNFGETNNDGKNMIAMLFASTDVSAVGSYTGNGTGQTITTGFQPRFLLIKNYTYIGGENWRILDTTRGWGSGNDNQIRFSSNLPQSANADWGAPTSTGFTLTASNDTAYNKNGTGYIYYAHA